MAIAPKPRQPAENKAVDADALILRGGGVAQASSEDEDDTAAFTMRVPRKLLRRLDAHLKTLPIKTPRQHFILEAVLEKLERENP